MITLRRSAERRHVRRGQRQVWSTFRREEGSRPSSGGFEPLIELTESWIPPGAIVPSAPFQDAEVITYVFEGALAGEGPTGGSAVTYAGVFQRGRPVRGHRETNASRNAWARVFQIALRCTAGGLQPGRETKRFSIAQRRGVLCLIASPDGSSGSLCVRSSARVHSAILDRGRHLAHELPPESRTWLHVVTGEVQTGGLVLGTGDSAGLTAERAVSLIAREDSEILLVGSTEPRSSSSSSGLAR